MTSDRRQLRGAVIGYGNVAEFGHMPYWRNSPEAEIVAIVDTDPARRESFVEAQPGRNAYPSTAELLSSEQLDFVDICSSPNSHAPLVLESLAAGLHVLCEKPLTLSAADTLRVAQQATMHARAIHTVHNWLEAPLCRYVSLLLQSGAIGVVRSIEWQTLRTSPAATVDANGSRNWRVDPQIAGGGILIDHGWHAIYCVGAWAPGKAREVRAKLENRGRIALDVEDTATLDINFGTADAHIHLTWAARERANTITIFGADGAIEVSGPELTLTRGRTVQRWTFPPSLAAGSHHPDWFANVARRFLESTSGARQSNVDDAVLCSRIIDTAKQSNASGCASVWITI